MVARTVQPWHKTQPAERVKAPSGLSELDRRALKLRKGRDASQSNRDRRKSHYARLAQRLAALKLEQASLRHREAMLSAELLRRAAAGQLRHQAHTTKDDSYHHDHFQNYLTPRHRGPPARSTLDRNTDSAVITSQYELPYHFALAWTLITWILSRFQALQTPAPGPLGTTICRRSTPCVSTLMWRPNGHTTACHRTARPPRPVPPRLSASAA